MGRAPCCDKTQVKRGPWSPEEDDTLKTYLHKYGTGGNWIALPHKAGLKRCGKSCRLRWLNYLRPDIKHGGFTEEEDNLILTLFANIGSRWSVIASHLPGRTDNDVKNYWNTKLKKKLMAGAIGPKFPPPATTINDPVNAAMDFGLAASFSPFNLQVQDNYYGNISAYPFKPSSDASTTLMPQYSMDAIRGYPEIGPDWLLGSPTDPFSLAGLQEVQENGTAFDGLFTTTSSSQEISGLSPSCSSLAKSYASCSWSTTENVINGEEMGIFVELEIKSSNHHRNTPPDHHQELVISSTSAEEDRSRLLVDYAVANFSDNPFPSQIS